MCISVCICVYECSLEGDADTSSADCFRDKTRQLGNSRRRLFTIIPLCLCHIINTHQQTKNSLNANNKMKTIQFNHFLFRFREAKQLPPKLQSLRLLPGLLGPAEATPMPASPAVLLTTPSMSISGHPPGLLIAQYWRLCHAHSILAIRNTFAPSH